LKPHVHPENLLDIILLARGSQGYSVSEEMYWMDAGDVLVIPPGAEHGTGGEPEEKALTYRVGVLTPKPGELFMDLPSPHDQVLLQSLINIEPRLFPGSPSLQEYLNTVLVDLLTIRHGVLRSTSIQCNLIMFLLEIVACAARQSKPAHREWRDRILLFVEEHIRDPITNQDLADHMGTSKTRFCVRFKEEFKTPPADYVRRRKIEIAKSELLRHPNVTITRIAFDLGFTSSQTFATVFRRYTGVTPSRFREIGEASQSA
jgi:AraC-like DNA-binding protein